ncbi:bifunctional 4-hydroxy-2-oxoglutarate aldolase/2-dehydro-3-deoxy-phosphogluconate aldolase [Luedemannella flava]|uniref:Bifunctional 4-hydroxy-2-oxoglutarate aldolase/2-dehydro-3-deoxy-phosphogluconate aldolase n=1 Tax=Luedemannella flava TaxID=349316 RepID=A0ABP4YJJ8_9ACTN
MSLELNALFGDARIMMILRGVGTPEAGVAAAERAWRLGVDLVEVPIGERAELPILEAVVAAGRSRGKDVGAGTIVSTEHVRLAVRAGARYTVAPGLDPQVAAASQNAGLPHMPGAFTATEVQTARRAGCTWVKVFPAGVLGPAWFRAMRGPFPRMSFMATGGVQPQDGRAYLDAGAAMVGFGVSALSPAHNGHVANLTRRTVK